MYNLFSFSLIKIMVFFASTLMFNQLLANEAAEQGAGKAVVDETSIEATAEKFNQVCATCHGRTGRGMASFPRLTDKDKEYLVKRLKQYRSGEKVGPNTPLMAPHAANLTDAEIDSLAMYIVSVLSAK